MTATADRQKIADAHPDTWIAVAPGDVLDGIITDVTEAWSDPRATWYPILVVKTDTGDQPELKVHCFGAVLYNEIMRQRPVIGDRVTITYLGVDETKTPKAGQSLPERYRVRVAGRDPVAQSERVYGRIERGGRNGAGPAAAAAPTVTGDEDIPPF